MIDDVYILGAGASVSAGAPVMKNFLDKADDLLRDKAFGPYEESIREVFSSEICWVLCIDHLI